jgi:Txe/YoeB family toxin of Txe-Axe toxin-antitoxin module
MWRPPIYALERADKMKLRITRLIRDFSRIDPLGIIAVNEQLRLHDPAIKI